MLEKTKINYSLVSIIIPCYNHGQFLDATLSSVLNQTYQDWECIVVDNGSTDNTKEVVEKFSLSDNRFRYLFIEQSGVSLARNVGIKNSTGKFILPLDADDKIETSYLDKAVEVLIKNEKIKIVYCKSELFGEQQGEWELPTFDLKQMLIENMIFCSALYRRSDFNITSGYNEEMKSGFEDWDFWLSILKNGGEVYRIPEILFYYRIRTDSRNNLIARDTDLQRSLRKVIYERHHELYQKHLSVPDLLQDNFNLKHQIQVLKNELDVCKANLKPVKTKNESFFIRKLLNYTSKIKSLFR